jgi:hypothetical protein
MSTKGFIRQVKAHIAELTDGLSEEEYLQYVDELVYELQKEYGEKTYSIEDNID